MYQRGVYRHGEGKRAAQKESRWVDGNKRNFEDGKLLLINRGQTHIPHENRGHAKLQLLYSIKLKSQITYKAVHTCVEMISAMLMECDSLCQTADLVNFISLDLYVHRKCRKIFRTLFWNEQYIIYSMLSFATEAELSDLISLKVWRCKQNVNIDAKLCLLSILLVLRADPAL